MQQSHSNTPTLLASASPRSLLTSSSISNTYQLTPRMPSQFRPIPHRTITVPAITHSDPTNNSCSSSSNTNTTSTSKSSASVVTQASSAVRQPPSPTC